LPLLRFAAGIADGTGRSASDGNRMMAEQLKSSQREQGNQVPDVQTVGGRIKAAVKRDGRGKFLFQFRRVGAIGDQAAPFEFFQNAHERRLNRRRPNANFQLVKIILALMLLIIVNFRLKDEKEDDNEEDWLTLDFGLRAWDFNLRACQKC